MRRLRLSGFLLFDGGLLLRFLGLEIMLRWLYFLEPQSVVACRFVSFNLPFADTLKQEVCFHFAQILVLILAV